jgi:hypothetical protein
LRDLGAKLTYADIELPPDAALISSMEIGCWITDAGQVDVLLGIPRTSRTELAQYAQLRANGPTVTIGGSSVVIAALQDIIRSKEIADRPKDREVLDELRRLVRAPQAFRPNAALDQATTRRA